MFELINDYSEWNTLLWKHFFPSDSDNDAILYLDENLLSQIATGHIRKSYPTWEEDFLSKTLLSEDKLCVFIREWRRRTGDAETCTKPNWESLVQFLSRKRLDGINASFAMVCCVMFLACKVGPNHSSIKNEAKKYLGDKYKGHVAELIDFLFQILHTTIRRFNPDRMVCGRQRHMSRIKFHMVLKKDDRSDFIDFLEVNDLQWSSGPYADYVNETLIPALSAANKRALINELIKEENIPYFKNILLSNLAFGKTSSGYQNAKQTKFLPWKYELRFDFDGNVSFSIIPQFYTPFDFEFRSGQFIKNDNNEISEIIGAELQFSTLGSYKFEHNGTTYCLRNIQVMTEEQWPTEVYFEQLSEDIFEQVCLLHNGGHYIKLIQKGLSQRKIEKLSQGWDALELEIEGYQAFEIEQYVSEESHKRITQQINDHYCFYGVGSWFGINLFEEQRLYWKPNLVGAEPIEITEYRKNQSGRVFFMLPRTSDYEVNGTLLVAKRQLEEIDLSEQIYRKFLWDGKKTKFYMNGWGEPSLTPPEKRTIPNPSGKFDLSHNKDCMNQGSEDSNMLLQILYDIADENGCVNQQKAVNAIDFCYEFMDIKPTTDNRSSLLYALRRLGYIYSFYDPTCRGYVNQLYPSYLEYSNYTIGVNRVCQLRGVYNATWQKTITGGSHCKSAKFKRPYSNDALIHNPEYRCLPDIILTTPNETIVYPVPFTTADYMLSIMENMSGFEQHVLNSIEGDSVYIPHELPTPCMQKDSHGKEYLCTGALNKGYKKHLYYRMANGQNTLIPKHLSRLYVQNYKKLPFCLMTTDLNKNLYQGELLFVKGMGLPEVFEMALCNLNLGMPSYETMFIVDQTTSGLPSKFTVTEGKKYLTNSSKMLQSGIQKCAGKKVDDHFPEESVFIRKNERQIHVEMKMIRYATRGLSLLLSDGSQLIAFSQGSKVYSVDSRTGRYNEVMSESINQAFSDLINLRRITVKEQYKGPIPQWNDPLAKKISIIQKL